MDKGIELEYKTLLTKEKFYELVDLYQPLQFIEQKNTYYVTDDPSHYGFRIREKNGKKLFTLKQWVNGQTMEYEKNFTGEISDDKEIQELLAQFKIYPPYKLFGSLTTYRAMYCDGLAELCFDINKYNGEADYEIEYEVKAEHDHKQAFLSILNKIKVDYVPSYGSKYQRCLQSIQKNQK